MTNLRALIVDDEPQSRSLIGKLISMHFAGFITDEAETVITAIEKIHQFNPDLIFLDIQLRGESGFDLLDKIKTPKFEIIFTTAHSEFALKAFHYSALDYLTKPIDTEEFKSGVQKVQARIKKQYAPDEQFEFLKELRQNHKPPDKLTIPTAEGFLFVTIADILYCHAVGNYTEFHLPRQQKIVSSHNLGYYNELLSEHNFFRVHRSSLVNMAHIKMYKRGDGGSIIMNDGEEIEVSRSNKEALLKLFKL